MSWTRALRSTTHLRNRLSLQLLCWGNLPRSGNTAVGTKPMCPDFRLSCSGGNGRTSVLSQGETSRVIPDETVHPSVSDIGQCRSRDSFGRKEELPGWSVCVKRTARHRFNAQCVFMVDCLAQAHLRGYRPWLHAHAQSRMTRSVRRAALRERIG